MIEFSKNDIVQLSKKNISQSKVLDQVQTFKKGIPFIFLDKAAVVADGILKFTEGEEKILVEKFENSRNGLDLLKFVPASGAASRMFNPTCSFYHIIL